MDQIFESTDLAVTAEILRTMYGPLRIRPQTEHHQMRLAQTSLGGIRFDRIGLMMDFEAQAAPHESMVIAVVRGGVIGYDDRNTWQGRYGPGDVYSASRPAGDYTSEIHGADVEFAIFDPGLLSEVAQPAGRRIGEPVRFTSHEPVSFEAARRWRSAYSYIRRDVAVDTGGEALHPLVTGSAVRHLLSCALAAFPNDALADPTIEDRRDASGITLRRAISFIEDNLDRDITPADIAAAAHVTIRSVQLAFRRHLEVTPTGYLRQARLSRAHQDLLAADPARDSVTAVAQRWGFASQGRFAAYYQRVYGQIPSETLRRQ